MTFLTYDFKIYKQNIAVMKNQIFNKKFWTPFYQFSLMLFFLLSFSNLLFAQQKVINGKVEDGNNTPLESVSITIKVKTFIKLLNHI